MRGHSARTALESAKRGLSLYSTCARRDLERMRHSPRLAYNGIMFQIKICGVTRPEDAACAAEAGADAIGLNFFSKSSRFVELETATEIAQAAPAGMAIAGVFVDAPAEFIARVAESVQLDWIQLHGDEPAALVADLPKSAQILRAWRVRDGFVDAIAAYWEAS